MRSIFSCLTQPNNPIPKNTEPPQSKSERSRFSSLRQLRSKISFSLRKRSKHHATEEEDTDSGTPEIDWAHTSSITPSQTPGGFKHWIPQEDHEFPFRIDDEASLNDPDWDGRAHFPTIVFDEGEMLDETLVRDELDALRWASLNGELDEGLDFPQDQLDGFIPRPKPSHLNTYHFSASSTTNQKRDNRFTSELDDDDDDDEKWDCARGKRMAGGGGVVRTTTMFVSPYDGDLDSTLSSDDDIFGLNELSDLSSLSDCETEFDVDEGCLASLMSHQDAPYGMIVEQRL